MEKTILPLRNRNLTGDQILDPAGGAIACQFPPALPDPRATSSLRLPVSDEGEEKKDGVNLLKVI